VEVLMGDVCRFDLAGRCVLLCDGSSIACDSLVVAAGSETSYFGHDDWESLAPGLKTIEDATDIPLERQETTRGEANEYHRC
jgi:NADH dehydrogenase